MFLAACTKKVLLEVVSPINKAVMPGKGLLGKHLVVFNNDLMYCIYIQYIRSLLKTTKCLPKSPLPGITALLMGETTSRSTFLVQAARNMTANRSNILLKQRRNLHLRVLAQFLLLNV